MKKIIYPLLFLCVGVFHSCTKDFSTIEVTYKKATAIYSDLSEIRNTPLLEAARSIENPGKIFVSDDILLVGEEEKGIHVIDNSDPSNPQPISFLNIPQNREFYVEGNQLFAESQYDMLKIDISNKQAPRLVSRVEGAFAQEFSNDNGEVLIGFEYEDVTEKFDGDLSQRDQVFKNGEVYYFDFANQLIPASAVPSSFAGNSNGGIGSVNRIAYQNDHVYVIGRSNLTILKNDAELTFLSTNRIGDDMETIFPYEDKIFIGTQNSMQVFDASDPANPQQESSFWHATSCDPVYPIDGVAYVTLRTGDFSNCPGDVNSLVVLDVETEVARFSSPTVLQEIQMESPYGLTLSNDKLYVGEGANGLKIFDATDRGNLKLENFDTTIEAYDVISHPSRTDLILIAGPKGLGQYEIEGVDKLSLVSWLDM